MKYDVEFSVKTQKDIFEVTAFLEKLLENLDKICVDYPNMTLTAVRTQNITVSWPEPKT
jgi:small-conductance mechanosensitive channel